MRTEAGTTFLHIISSESPTETVKVTRKTYTQNWPAYNAAQTEEKSRLQALLYELCKAIPEPEQRRGRPRLSLADIIFASTFKISVRL